MILGIRFILGFKDTTFSSILVFLLAYHNAPNTSVGEIELNKAKLSPVLVNVCIEP